MPGVNSESVAEYAISALLLVARRMHLINHTLRSKGLEFGARHRRAVNRADGAHYRHRRCRQHRQAGSRKSAMPGFA
jgi:phosphoglycerate dehydrogenase-like enzyme